MAVQSSVYDLIDHLDKGGSVDDFVPPQSTATPETSYLGELAGNIPGSALNLASDLIYPFMNPTETAKSIRDLGVGVYSLMTDGDKPEEATAEAVGQYFADRYGSAEAFSNSLKTDPVGVVSDIAGVFTGGATIVGKTAGKAGKVAAQLDSPKIAEKAQQLQSIAEKTANVAQQVDPASALLVNPVVSKGAQKVADVAASIPPAIAGRYTGVGSDAYVEGFRAVREGGEASREFFQGLKSPDVTGTSAQALENLSKIRKQASDSYAAGISALNLSEIPTDWAPARRLIAESRKENNITNRPNRRRGSLKDESKNEINELYKDINRSIGNPSDRDMKGVSDALQRLNESFGDLKNNSSKKFAMEMKQTLKQMLRDAVGPQYDRVLEPYAQQMELIDQFRTELKVKPDANPNQIYRGLLRSMRSNVNTNFGQSADLLRQLDAANPQSNLTAGLAGETLSPLTPTTISTLLPAGATAAAAANFINPSAAALFALGSPRVSGYATGILGLGARAADRVSPFLPPRGATAQTARAAGILGQIGTDERRNLQDSSLRNYLRSLNGS